MVKKKDEDFRIIDPEGSAKKLIKEMNTLNSIQDILCKNLMLRKTDFDMDNFFSAEHPSDGLSYCMLHSSIPCRHPHCTTCAFLPFSKGRVTVLLDEIDREMTKKKLMEEERTYSPDKKEFVEDSMKIVKKIVDDGQISAEEMRELIKDMINERDD